MVTGAVTLVLQWDSRGQEGDQTFLSGQQAQGQCLLSVPHSRNKKMSKPKRSWLWSLQFSGEADGHPGKDSTLQERV